MHGLLLLLMAGDFWHSSRIPDVLFSLPFVMDG